MLFDLSSGKRRRVVQVVYATLALLMGGSLVLFGIGSDAPGGILDAVGLGSNSDDGGETQYDEQIQNAEEKLETDPANAAALLNLTRYQYLSANSRISSDPETGQISEIPPEATSELEQAVDAWQRYLETKPESPDASVASNATQAYILLNDAAGAAEAQRYVARDQNTASAWGNLAFYLYADFEFEDADEAAAKAIELTDESNREQAEQQFEQIAAQARAEQVRIEKEGEKGDKGDTAAGEQQLTDPFGALGGSGGLAPTTP